MCITKACGDPTSPGVWWRDDTKWKQYDDAVAAAIEQGITDRTSRVELGTLVSSKHGRGAEYVVDLTTMTQTNVATGFTRDVKVVKAPSAGATAPSDDVAALKEQVRVCHESIRVLTRMVKKLEADLLAKEMQSSDDEGNSLLEKMVRLLRDPLGGQYRESYDSVEDYCSDSSDDDC